MTGRCAGLFYGVGRLWVTEDDSELARFEAGDKEADSGPTAELEILRGDIARLIYDAVRERADFRSATGSTVSNRMGPAST